MKDVEIKHGGMEEFEDNCIKVDFANKFIGGGALGFGNVQEELMFT